MFCGSGFSKAGGRYNLAFPGDKPLREPLLLEASRLRSGRVHFVAFWQQAAIGELYVDSDTLVLPSIYSETWELVVNEAMQFGFPCIVRDRVGFGPDLVIFDVTRQMLTHGAAGELGGQFSKNGDDGDGRTPPGACQAPR